MVLGGEGGGGQATAGLLLCCDGVWSGVVEMMRRPVEKLGYGLLLYTVCSEVAIVKSTAAEGQGGGSSTYLSQR